MSLDDKTVLSILQRNFNPNQIKQRKGGWNKEKGEYEVYTYVSSDDITARLNEAFGLGWSLDVVGFNGTNMEDFIVADSKGEKAVVIMAAISFTNEKGKEQRRVGVGSKKITTELGNDFKSALSKALSNAAKKLGVAVNLTDEDSDDDEAVKSTDGLSISSTKIVGLEDGKKPMGITIGGAKTTTKAESQESPTEKSVPIKTGGLTIGGAKNVAKESPTEETPAEPIKESPVEENPVKETTGLKIGKLGGDVDIKCESCSGDIVATMTSEGNTMEAKDIVTLSQSLFKKNMCSVCIKTTRENMMKKGK